MRSRGGTRLGTATLRETRSSFPHYRIQFCKSPKERAMGQKKKKKGSIKSIKKNTSCACVYILILRGQVLHHHHRIVSSRVARRSGLDARVHVVNQSTHS